MLYPLSYEGLGCVFALDTGRVSVRWARARYPAPHGLCRTCAACRVTGSCPKSPPRGAPFVRLASPIHGCDGLVGSLVRPLLLMLLLGGGWGVVPGCRVGGRRFHWPGGVFRVVGSGGGWSGWWQGEDRGERLA